jgi:DNA-binding transcriptional LysR family regulator
VATSATQEKSELLLDSPKLCLGEGMDDDRHDLDPRRLLVFAEVARRGSLAAAAQHLGWTQPAVAQHVKRLERDAGCALLVRTPRGVTLTEAGRALAEHATAITARLRAAREDLAALAELRTGRVRLAAFPSACATFVPSALARLQSEAPGLDVRLTEAEPPQARRLLDDGDVDLAVTFVYPDVPEDPAASRAVDRTVLFEDPLLLVLPVGSALVARTDVTLGDAAAERWIAGCPRCRAHLLAAAAAVGFLPDIRHSTDDYVVTQTLVAAGLGVALLPALAIEAADVPGVHPVPPRGSPPRTIALDRAVDLPAGPSVLAVTDALLAVTAARRPALSG